MSVYVDSHIQYICYLWSYTTCATYPLSYISMCRSISLRTPQPPSEWYDMELRHQATSRAVGCPHGPTTPLLPLTLPVTGIHPAYQTVAIYQYPFCRYLIHTPSTYPPTWQLHHLSPLHRFSIYRKKSVSQMLFLSIMKTTTIISK